MPDLEVLRDLTPQFPPPGLDELAAVVRRRRRRAVLTAGAGALAAVVVVATLIGGMPRSDRSTDPVDDPTDGRTAGRPRTSPGPPTGSAPRATPHRLVGGTGRRARGAVLVGLRESQLRLRRHATGDNYDYRVIHSALEVTVDGYRTSGLFGLNGGPGEIPEIQQQPFDDDSIYVQDWGRQGGTQERYRLLNADGTTTELTMLPSTAPPAAGPDMVRTSSGATFGPRPGLSRVDDAAGTIQRLDLPAAVYQWAESAADELLWGVARRLRRVLAAAGRRLRPPRPGLQVPVPDLSIDDDDPRPAAWFTAERMAVTELGGSKGLPVALHVSLDRGDTWQRIPVTEDTVDDVLARLR